MTPEVHFGIAGWSYDDWRGVVYPRTCRDTLVHVARRVDFIEINSTFYRLPEPAVAEDWVRRTAALPTFFTAKLPRSVTHDRRIDDAAVADVLTSLAPLLEASRLRVLLAQFPHWFDATDGNFRHLQRIVSAFAGCAPVALEVRHGSWSAPSALERVAELGSSLAHLDYPGAFDAADTRVFGPHGLAYFRLHGRNRSTWFDRDAHRDQVYDWIYSTDEVGQVRERIENISKHAATYVVANNHFHGKAMKLVLELVAQWRRTLVDVPDELLRVYPEMRPIARAAQGELF